MGRKKTTRQERIQTQHLKPGPELDIRVCKAAGLRSCGPPHIYADMDSWVVWSVLPSRKLGDAVIAAEQVTDRGRIVIERLDDGRAEAPWRCYLKCSTTGCEAEAFDISAPLAVCRAILALSTLNHAKDWKPKWAPGFAKVRWLKERPIE